MRGATTPCILGPFMSFASAIPAALPLASSGGVFALVEFVLSLLPSERLTAAEEALIERARELTGSFGAYILEAGSRDELLGRVDAVLEDPQFHEAVLHFVSTSMAEQGFDLVEAFDEVAGKDVAASGLAHALGPASVPALRQLDANIVEAFRCVKPLLAAFVPDAEPTAPGVVSDEPLAFISAPEVPVPIARAWLATYRLGALLFAAGALHFGSFSGERWLGLAIAELLAENSRRLLAFVAALTGHDVPVSLLPEEERLDLHGLTGAAQAVREAYERFNTAAERSGEPVFPASS